MVTPFIATSIICLCSGLIVLVSQKVSGAENLEGYTLIIKAFQSVHKAFPSLLFLIIPLFGFSTSIAQGYCGQKTWESIFGKKTLFIYQIIFFVSYFFCGLVDQFDLLLDLADMINLSTTIPSILALYFLLPTIRKWKEK